LSAHLEAKFGAQVELERASNGMFEIFADEELVFSKIQQGRFPTHKEIDRLLSERG